VDARAAVLGVSRSEAVRVALRGRGPLGGARPIDRERVMRGLVRALEERGSVRAAELLPAGERERHEAESAFAQQLDALRAPSRRVLG